MGADDQRRHRGFGGVEKVGLARALLAGGGSQNHRNPKRVEEATEVQVVLLGEDLGGRHQRGLPTAFVGLDHRAEGDEGFARADIALQEAMVHFDYGRFGEAEEVINAWGLQNSLEGQIVLARCEWERGREDAALQRLERGGEARGDAEGEPDAAGEAEPLREGGCERVKEGEGLAPGVKVPRGVLLSASEALPAAVRDAVAHVIAELDAGRLRGLGDRQRKALLAKFD